MSVEMRNPMTGSEESERVTMQRERISNQRDFEKCLRR
jgi:hypothetical protein